MKIYLFEKVKFPKLINRIGRGQKVESELPAKRKRSDSKASNAQDPDATVVQPVRHKLRRTKKNENLRDEWKRYHNNFIPVISSEPTDPNATINASTSLENTNSNSILKSRNSISQSYENIKYTIKNTISGNNNKNKNGDDSSELKDQHIHKKRRLLSFIPI